MKNDRFEYCEDMDDICEAVNYNFSVIEHKIKKTNRRVNNAYLLLGGAMIFMYRKFAIAIENLNIKCGNF